MRKNKTFIEKFCALLSPGFTFVAMFILVRISDLPQKSHRSKLISLIETVADIFLIYSTIAWIVLYFKTKALEKTIGLSRDRWFTIYPKTVVSIVVSLVFSFLMHNVYFITNGYGFIGIVIVTLGYIFTYQLVSFFS